RPPPRSALFPYTTLFRSATGGSAELAVHPWWYYGPRLLVDALPWSLLLIPAGIIFLRHGAWRRDREARFGLLWLVAITAVLSCRSEEHTSELQSRFDLVC